MKLKVIALAICIALTACSGTSAVRPVRGELDGVNMPHVRVALNYIGPINPFTNQHQASYGREWDVVAEPTLTSIATSPFYGVGGTCNADRTECKFGAVKAVLRFRFDRDGRDWVVHGELTWSVARKQTGDIAVGMTTSHYEESIDDGVDLVNAQFTPQQNFRWVVTPGQSFEMTGPLGAKIVWSGPTAQ